MAEYDFSTLSSSDLENLVCDLLNADLPEPSEISYKTFKDGKDKGIDFLYSSELKQYDHIGQVKHYFRTGFNKLLADLKSTEVAKVKKLKPNKYIVATSVDLSVQQTEWIKDAFNPYLKDLNDIYGKKDLNRLLEKYEDILTSHFKLWFSDTTVLKKILNSDLIYRSADFVNSELTSRLRLYVKTPLLDTARKSLAKNKFIVITGEPGVGKSTLAEMLVYEYLKDDYKLLYINDDIRDVERFLAPDDSKQLIYFDDFLGSNAVEINKAQGSETALINTIRRIKKLENKLLIFTTRVHILNTVIDQSEKLKKANLKLGETILSLNEYDIEIKKQMLTNHIEEADISDELKLILEENDTFDFIVNHHSFNPRSIQYITRVENIGNIGPTDYKKFIKDNFDDPQEIWSHAYKYQIGAAERILLNTLFTFDESVEVDTLKKAFYRRVSEEENAKNQLEVNAFKTALVRLDKGFIIIKNIKVNFFNASLKDFLKNFLKSDPIEISNMLNGVRFIRQLSEQLLSIAQPHNLKPSDDLKLDIMEHYGDYLRSNYRDHDLIRLAIFIQNEAISHDKDDYLVHILYSINDWESLYKDYSLYKSFSRFLESTKHNNKILDVLMERTSEIVNDMFLAEDDVFKAVDLLEQLTDTFKIDFQNYDTKDITRHLDELFGEHISNEVDWLKDWITDEYESDEKIKKVKDLNERIVALDLDYDVDMHEFEEDWWEIAQANEFRRLMEKDK